MTLRPVVSTAVVAAVTAFLVGFAAPQISGGEWSTAADRLPACPSGEAAGAGPAEPSGLPAVGRSGPAAVEPSGWAATGRSGLPAVGEPGVCRARPTGVEPVGDGALPVPRPGYHHLGATTVDGWSGVLGRLTVRDPGVRAGSQDFVAARFLARQELGGGRLAWLEVGWVETGWSGGGTQRVYSFDSQARSWVFFDDYPLADGDRIWVYLHSEMENGQVGWRAWLWWADRWQLLAAPEDLPVPDRARLEQYVEVHQDRPGPPIQVPPVTVDRVQVRDQPDRPLLPWRADRVPTGSREPGPDYCLAWQHRYDSWSAGDCAATVQG